MKRAGFFAWVAIAAGTLLGAASGCELIASVDRSKIGEGGGGAGGATGGGGAPTTTTTTGGGGTGGAMCMDAATDCTDALSADCKVWTCDADGACAEADAADGVDATTQTDGDCKKNVCMAGAATPADDDADIFDDMNDCTVDTCNAGSPQSDSAAAGAMCAMDGGKVCDGMSVCVECNDNADCTDTTKPVCSMGNNCIPATCTDGLINGGETDIDCGGADCDACDTGMTCSVATDCYHGVCDGVAMTCTAPTCSDAVQNGGTYLGDDGETDVDCGGPCGPTCGPMKSCDINGDCVGNQCSGMGGACVPNCADMVKNNVETDIDCGGGTCGGCAVGDDCGADTDCVNTAFCDMGGKCAAKKPLGDACMGNNQCTSTTCADGVCCNNPCNKNCESCSLAGTVGTCTYIPGGTDPANECTGNGGSDVCDGAGNCLKGGGTSCTVGGECATSFCADSVCCDALCDGLCQACSMAKTGGANGTCGSVTNNTDPDNECVASLDCNGSGACEAKLANGAACTVAGECSSNQCVDGVCCNSACGSLCQACSAAKKGGGLDGACAAIISGLDPDNECAGALSCNGSGACETPLADGMPCMAAGQCMSTNCVDGVCCDTTCIGTCEACSAAKSGGTDGVCTFSMSGTDPDTECGGTNCNGSGACN